jgi:hypothetical protein
MVKLSRRDERMVSKRARSEPLSEPPYDLELVPNVDDASLIDGSVLVMQTDRDAWKAALTELLLLCNEAAWRSSKRHDAGARGLPLPAAPAEAKPLVLEYILDRLDTDDPLNGYQLRTRAEGWLQGFVTFTTFTTWQTYFRWDSLDPRAGITLDDCDAHVVDESGELAAALDECGRVGDPDRCGVVWPRVAEITLLGGLGCGAQLLQLALDHLASLNTYDFVVLQVRARPRARAREQRGARARTHRAIHCESCIALRLRACVLRRAIHTRVRSGDRQRRSLLRAARLHARRRRRRAPRAAASRDRRRRRQGERAAAPEKAKASDAQIRGSQIAPAAQRQRGARARARGGRDAAPARARAGRAQRGCRRLASSRGRKAVVGQSRAARICKGARKAVVGQSPTRARA